MFCEGLKSRDCSHIDSRAMGPLTCFATRSNRSLLPPPYSQLNHAVSLFFNDIPRMVLCIPVSVEVSPTFSSL